MPSIERKTLSRLQEGDRLLSDAGVFAKQGQPLEGKAIKLLARHKVDWVPVISATYEEKEKLAQKELDEDRFLKDQIRRYNDPFFTMKGRLLEKLKTIYTPFDEEDRIFCAQGKKKQLTKNILMEPSPGVLYKEDILAGSYQLLAPTEIKYLKEGLRGIQSQLDKLTRRDKETRGQKKRIPLQRISSVRLLSFYDGSRLSTMGDALPWHALESAVTFLTVMTNINKKRIVQGFPLAESRFNPDKKNVSIKDKFQFRPDAILDAALGILLHAVGYSHHTIHQLISTRPTLERETKQGIKTLRQIQRAYWVSRHLLEGRDDIAPISRMMVNLQSDYPDGKGYPPPNRNPFLHEFVRLFQIIDFYDSLTHPVIQRMNFSRMAAIEHMKNHSGTYEYQQDVFNPQSRFDKELLQEWLDLLAPWEIGEKVYLFPRNNRSSCFFVGRVYSYMDSEIPLITILRDERSGKNYPPGKMLLHIPSSTAFMMAEGKIQKKIKQEWIAKLEIFDKTCDAAEIKDFEDLILGKERALAKHLR